MDDAEGQPPTLTVGTTCERGGERRVALVPETVEELTRLGLKVVIQSGAGGGARLDDEAYFSAGAAVLADAASVYRQADILAAVQPPEPQDIEVLRPGTLVISFLDPGRRPDIVEAAGRRGIILFSFNRVPRITKAQSMDAMSSMSTVSGYKSVLLAADTIGRFFPLLMTAAGTVPPARVIVIGAGVAGLQALATARRLGAVTAACDARPAVREQIQSVGASFIDMSVPMEAEGEGGYAKQLDEEIYRLERDAIRDHVAGADVVITTALVPGAAAPLLIDEAMVSAMKPGSVIVDLASEAGGNCELTVPGQTVTRCEVTILGPTNLPSEVPVHASQMYARNVLTVLKYLVKDGKLEIDPDDEIVRGACFMPAAATPETTGGM